MNIISFIKSDKCLPTTLVLFIIIILISLNYVSGYNKYYLLVCMISQLLTLIGIYTNNLTLIGYTHIICGITFLIGTFLLKNKIINAVILLKIVVILLSRLIRNNCMYDDYTLLYMDKLPDNFGITMYSSLLIINTYNFLEKS